MRRIASLSDAPIGSTIQFVYYGGSRYGCTRTVEVTGYNGRNGIQGIDKDVNEPRAYLNGSAGPVNVLSEASPTPQAASTLRPTSVHFTVARQELRDKVDEMSLEQLAEVFAIHRGGINPNIDMTTHCVTYETLQKTFKVNGQIMTVAELAELVKANS